MEIAIKLRDKLLEYSDGDVGYSKGIMVNAQSDKCRQDILDILEEEPDLPKDRLLLISVALGEWEKKNGLR